ncbi:protein naked cuticle homolog 2 [Leptonychotes weddellii]|uniref:Protein naked cuticle homolog n=1 Tax=Leptonychotes weddellii TaxID=9713 RepID=A0A7F8RVL7_LEPWE|nr:protein naked cuticle homolog 2 [Leptonychotes weddellii]
MLRPSGVSSRTTKGSALETLLADPVGAHRLRNQHFLSTKAEAERPVEQASTRERRRHIIATLAPVGGVRRPGGPTDTAPLNPGDSFVVSAFASGCEGTEDAERNTGSKQGPPGGDPKEGPFWEDWCPLEVVLPPEKAEGREGTGLISSVVNAERAASREGPRGPGKKHLNIDGLQCDVSVEGDSHQDWTFTLYGFDHIGKATREDMSSLVHAIYEAIDASVSHSSDSSRTLRVKLTVSPESLSERKESPPTGQDQEPTRCRMEAELTGDPGGADKRPSAHTRRPGADPHPCCERGPYCVDENTERRNHYLDLAGIENYTSRFGPGAPPSQAKQEHLGKAAHPLSRSRSQEADTRTALQRRPQVLAHHPLLAAEPAVRALDMQPRLKGQEKQLLKPPRGSGRPPGAPGTGKPGRAFGCPPPAAPPQAPRDGHRLPQPPPQPHGHRRARRKSREVHSPLRAALGQPAALEHEVLRALPPMLAGEGCAVPAVHHHHAS